jgi:glycosyltransferase involved in cell wall biosynthesis
MGIILGIDASRNRSGGAQAHLVGLLSSINISECNIEEVHVWSFESLLNAIPDFPWLVKHFTLNLEKSLYKQLWWQAIILKKEAKNANCDILFTTDASSLCLFNPMVVMSQDMLSYEPGVMKYFGFGLSRIRLIIILFIQNFALKRADGVIFLTEYARKVIQNSCGRLKNTTVIPHGIDLNFRTIDHEQNWPLNSNETIRCVYVSPVWPFKHQDNLVVAIEKLRNQGHSISLDLIGGGSKKSINKLKDQIYLSDPNGLFIHYHGAIDHQEIPNYISEANIFIFASSCENLPITLLEAMAAGIPIACSNRGPMPEVIQDGGVFFDPEDVLSISDSINKLIKDHSLREKLRAKSKKISNKFTWQNNAIQTTAFIEKTLLSIDKIVE